MRGEFEPSSGSHFCEPALHVARGQVAAVAAGGDGARATLANGRCEAGDSGISVRGQVTVLSRRTYQVWHPNAAAYYVPTTFNLTNGAEPDWTN